MYSLFSGVFSGGSVFFFVFKKSKVQISLIILDDENFLKMNISSRRKLRLGLKPDSLILLRFRLKKSLSFESFEKREFC